MSIYRLMVKPERLWRKNITIERGLKYLEEFVGGKNTISHDDAKIISINMEQNSLG